MRRYVVNRSDLQAARDIRRKFYDQEPSKEERVPWKWPKRMREVGTLEAIMYTSDKWQRPGHLIDYKHRREAHQRLLAVDGFASPYGSSEHLDLVGPIVELEGMPSSFAVLAPILGVQTQLYVEDGPDGYALPPSGKGLYQIDVPGGKLGAAKHPESGDTFLLVYTKSGVHAMVVGEQLDVEKDGIVG
jgi:hypothetical protein